MLRKSIPLVAPSACSYWHDKACAIASPQVLAGDIYHSGFCRAIFFCSEWNASQRAPPKDLKESYEVLYYAWFQRHVSPMSASSREQSRKDIDMRQTWGSVKKRNDRADIDLRRTKIPSIRHGMGRSFGQLHELGLSITLFDRIAMFNFDFTYCHRRGIKQVQFRTIQVHITTLSWFQFQ